MGTVISATIAQLRLFFRIAGFFRIDVYMVVGVSWILIRHIGGANKSTISQKELIKANTIYCGWPSWYRSF
jgi:hypothetical protein